MEEPLDEGLEEAFLLVEGWMLGAAMFAEAMAEVVRVPPANDSEPLPGH
jgi:hypothetical protein